MTKKSWSVLLNNWCVDLNKACGCSKPNFKPGMPIYQKAINYYKQTEIFVQAKLKVADCLHFYHWVQQQAMIKTFICYKIKELSVKSHNSQANTEFMWQLGEWFAGTWHH